jgi:hypothetical protein
MKLKQLFTFNKVEAASCRLTLEDKRQDAASTFG